MASISSLFSEAEICRRLGDLAKAEELLRRIVREQPGAHAAWHSLGLIAHQGGRLDRANELLLKAISLDQSQALYHRNLGELFRLQGQLDLAIERGKTAIDLAPEDADANYNLGIALADKGRLEDARRVYEKAVELKPSHNLAWNNLGACYERSGDRDKALDAYRRAIAIDPDHAEAQNNAGALLSEQGELDEARACFEAAVAAKPNFAEAHQNLSTLKTYRPGDPHLAMLERLALSSASFSDSARTRLYFALGKAREDVGYHAGAFAAFAAANRQHRKTLQHNEARAERLCGAIARTFDRDFVDRHRGRGHPDPMPIFVLGMPRSGTTLVEQILASHPAVHGAGEITDLHQCIKVATGSRDFSDMERWMQELQPDVWRDIGKAYVERLNQRPPGAACTRITDKMPGNHHFIGWIHLVLPEAKIVHVMRDPMDSCWSNYTRLFTRTMEFAYDLEELGRQYNRYIGMMRHWHDVLPKGAIHHIRYERLVADLEGEIRRLLAFAELEFNPACLAFHKNRRQVRTASVAQVRKPLYASSIGRWRPYQAELEPLRAIVGDGYPHGLSQDGTMTEKTISIID